VGESDGSCAPLLLEDVHAWPAQHNIEVHTVDADVGVVLDAKIDVLLDTKSKVALVREVLAAQFELTDLEAPLEDLFCLWSPDSAVNRDLLVSPDSERTDGVSGLGEDGSPGEFPWTCLLLNQNNDFIGTCAIIPSDFTNNNNRPTRKVLTAAHKLKVLEATDLLKVRVGEYDASGFNDPEAVDHEEYTVTRILKHPQMSNTRLSNDIAILYVERDINLNHPYVNTACLPSCDNQFDYQFSNGTGVRCYVAGWGKDEADGSFQFIPRKVDVPIVNNVQCQAGLRNALNQQRPGAGNNFRLHPSEICAGAEIGKDACTGDGGSPLVCQADSGRWTVMGLVTWGVGCASDVPGVYARVSHFRNWINAN